MRDFDMRTPGERWHEEVEQEGFVKPFLTFSSAMIVIFLIVIFLGGSAEPQKAEGAVIDFGEVNEPVFIMETHEEAIDADSEQTDVGFEEPISIPEEDPEPDYSWKDGVYWDTGAIWEEPVYSYPVYEEPGSLRTNGIESDGDYQYTWYSQQVLPGGGLDIPGRHVDDEGYICDGDGNIVLASSDLEQGSVVETPYGTGKVYDTGCPSGILDVYTNW